MFFQQARTVATSGLWILDFGCLNFSANRRERFRVNHSRPQNLRRRNRQIQNRGFNADLRLAAVHNQRNFSAKLFADVLRVRRRNAVGQIRARRGQRKTAFANHGLNERMTRPANADGFAARRHDCRECFPRAAKPASAGRARTILQVCPPAAGQFCHAAFRHFIAGDVDDDGIVRRAALDLKNFGDGFFVQRICREAINRFRRQRDDFAGAQQFRRAPDGFLKKLRRVRGKNFGGHALFVAQSVNRVELGRLPRGIKTGDDADDRAGNGGDADPHVPA